ncbi:B-cell CLL/lymphoma 7 protein family member A-like isoform X2 [Dysidea avara]|uniref:B-cell CLL/lymphoma 7 protein family member A-like isoform X2 n=1 Tax=Dysidea avara TaxID=196820 RepID=UPI00332BF7AE
MKSERLCYRVTKEKRWVELGLANSLKVYKWIPVKEDQPDDDKNQPKQQELEPVVTAVTNESTEIMIDSGNTSQSQPIEDLIKPSNSLPTDILASNDADSFAANSTTSVTSLIATSESNNSSDNKVEERSSRSPTQQSSANRDRSRSPH